MGKTLYADKRVFLRELVQNAVDACHLRSLREPDYSPAISIHLNANEDQVIIKDNGIGMDRTWVEKYFLNVGVSFYRSGELNDISMDSKLQLDFISNFGIGFLSTFLVAHRITVKTRKPVARGLLITITDINDYFDMQYHDDLPIGTEVILELKSSGPKVWRSMEFLGYLISAARFVTIPIQFKDAQGSTTVIGRQPMNVFPSVAAMRNFSAALQISPSQGCLLIRTRGTDDRIFGLETATGGISIFQNGILVNQTDELLPQNAKAFVVGRLNLIGHDKCELSMDRNRIFWQQHQLRFLKRAVLHAIADATGQLLSETGRLNTAPEARRKIEQTVASFFDLSTTDDALFQTLSPRIQRLLRQHFRSFLRTAISRTDSRTCDLTDMAAAQGFRYGWQRSVMATMAQAVELPNDP